MKIQTKLTKRRNWKWKHLKKGWASERTRQLFNRLQIEIKLSPNAWAWELEWARACVRESPCVYKGFLLSTVINSTLSPTLSSFNASRNYKSNGQHQEQKIDIWAVKDNRAMMTALMPLMPMMPMMLMTADSYKNQSIVDFNYVHRYLDGECGNYGAQPSHNFIWLLFNRSFSQQ